METKNENNTIRHRDGRPAGHNDEGTLYRVSEFVRRSGGGSQACRRINGVRRNLGRTCDGGQDSSS